MAPPIREDFDEATLPNDILWIYDSSPEGRIELRGDTESVVTDNIPGFFINPNHYTGSNRMRGNFFECDQTVELTRQGFYLGRPQSTSVQLLVYESATENGTYSLISSNTVTAPVGTNYVYGTLNTILKEGKYYMIGAAWNNSARYSTSGSHPQQTAFGQSLGGYTASGYPAANSISGASPSSLTYVQKLDLATNMVMRMDDSISAGQTATNSLGLVVDIEGLDPVTLSFKHRASGEEDQPGDGIFLSNDSGTSFTKIYDLPNGTTGWQTFNLDINALAAQNGIPITGNPVIKFQQVDNYSWPTDGREFDDIRIYSNADIDLDDADYLFVSNTNNIWKTVLGTRNIPIELQTTLRSGVAAESYPNTAYRFTILDGATPVFSNSANRNISFPALETEEDDWTANFYIPGTEKFAKNNYTILIEADADNQINEGRENNNTATLPITINQYSGKLYFDDIETEITVTDWSRTSDTHHTISGTGLLSGYPFTFTNLQAIKDPATLDYTMNPADWQTINVDVPDQFEQQDIHYTFSSPVRLTANGGTVDVEVRLPSGLGISTHQTYMMDSTIEFYDVPVDTALSMNTSLTRNANFQLSEETKPLWIAATSATWHPTLGTFEFTHEGSIVCTRTAGHEFLESNSSNMVDPNLALKRSNAEYYRFVDSVQSDITVTTTANEDARLSTKLALSPGYFSPHLPYGPEISWNYSSQLELTDDLPTTGSALADPGALSITYATTCAEAACSAPADPETLPLVPNDYFMTFSKDGGLDLPVYFNATDIRWGRGQNGLYAQEASNFNNGRFYMPGHFIRNDQSQLSSDLNVGPAVILLSGMRPDTGDMERPGHYSGNEDYRAGLADYAGLNLRVEENLYRAARSVLGGEQTDYWLQTERSKYYVRPSGVTGIHEAEPYSFPDTLEIYGYLHQFDQYGLSYLSGNPVESRTDGLVMLPYPSSFDVEYDGLRFDCLGEILGGELANASDKLMAYWNAVIDPRTFFYAPTDASTCANSARVLCLGITTACANIDGLLSGVLGFMPNGNLANKAAGVQNVDSRLSLPDRIQLDGPGSEEYHFTPILSAYYNDYENRGGGSADIGWINFAGALDVAFFDDLNVLFHTSASTNSSTAPIYMTGGFSDGSAQTFHVNPGTFDELNAGKPSGVIVDDFRNPYTDQYRVHARKTWLEIVNFDYPLNWSTSTKSFQSAEPVENDIVVLKLEHQADYLSADHAEISFGVQYDGLPQINIANMAFNAIDEQTGMASAVLNSVNSNLFQTIFSGLTQFDNLLADVPEKLFEPILAQSVDPIVDELYTALNNAYAAAPDTDYYSSLIQGYVAGPVGSVQQQLEDLVDTSGNAVNMLDEIDEHLEQALRVIDAFVNTVEYDPLTGQQLAQPISGLLNLQGTQFEFLGDLAAGIIGTMAADLANELAGELVPELNETLEELKPALDTAREYLTEIRDVIEEAKAQLAAGESFVRELQNALDPAQLQAAMDAAVSDLTEQFDDLQAAGDLFEEYTAEEIKTLIRQSIEDRFYASLACCNIQQVIRSRLYDVQASVETAIDGVFQQVNTAIKNVIGEYLTAIDEEINGMLGDLSDLVGAGQIDGYAHVKHDSLTELRLDGAFQWKVPEEMEFSAYMIIRQLNADGSSSCGLPGDNATEVILGTDDVGLSWVGSDLRAKINTKFAFSSGPFKPIGLAGAFEMTEGSVSFEAFKITELYAAAAFGARENYLSAALRCEMTSFEVEGGVFFGRTCSLDPFAWDPDVQGILGDPPFTGVYVYGEGWMPIVDYGCLFRIKAGVGAGMFAFLEGPIGGKVFLGAEGEALCVVGVRGEVTLVGMKNGDLMRMKGKGKISGKVGPCPFCVKFSASAEITYENGDWDADY
ncbi:hypothetical protein [Pontiella agarivorans]|uniref:CARDB domain-containing protein n=1 Tax=Pontiella agarivorans TaxID=3038953 RepID=A0ABU5MXW4_9BACT|nr:hypothetical protein [Pontiella agarivorans]MDZ8119015.1 hypothetical protein [Pontiella agarivorans]